MRKAILAAAALIVAVFAFAQPVRAADYMGQLLDGKVFRALVYSNQGAEFAVVTFVRDEVRVLLFDGETLTVNLYDPTIMNPHFIGGKSLDGHFYRIDIDDASFLFATEILPIMGGSEINGVCMPGPDGICRYGTGNAFGAPAGFLAPGFGFNGSQRLIGRGGGH